MDRVSQYIRRKSIEGHHQRRSSGSGLPPHSHSRRNSNELNPFMAPYPMPPPTPEQSVLPLAYAQEVKYDNTIGQYVATENQNHTNVSLQSHAPPPPPPPQRRRSRLSQDLIPPVVHEENINVNTNVRNFAENAQLTAQFSSVPSHRRASFSNENCGSIYANAVDYDQVLLKAVEEVDLQTTQQAIKQGANVNVVNQFGQSPLHLLCASKLTTSPKSNNNNHNQQDLLAQSQADKNAIIDALKEAGAKIDARDYLKRTPSHMAVLSGNGSCLKRLILHCADINAADYEGITPLHIACANNYRQSVMFLIYDDVDPNVQDINGMTALHHAAALNQYEMVKLLLTHGVYPTIRDKCGRSAFDLAKQQDALRAGAVLAKASKFQQPSPGKLTPEQERLLKEEDEMNNVKSFEDLTIHMTDEIGHINEIKTWQNSTAISTMSSQFSTENPQDDIEDDIDESFFNYNSDLILTETWRSAYDFENPIAGLPSPTPVMTQSLPNEGKKTKTATIDAPTGSININGDARNRRNSLTSTPSLQRVSASDLPLPPSTEILIQKQIQKQEERIMRRNSLSSQTENTERRRSLVPL